MNTGIVIATRTDSSRLPNKVFRKINGVPLIELLIQRLQKTNLPIFIAFPKEQKKAYEYLKQFDNVWLHESKYYDDPLARMRECAQMNNLDTIIRISHDKIVIENDDIKKALEIFKEKSLDYLYSTKFTAGTGFEIISYSSLEAASKKFKNIEYIGYAIRGVTDKIYNWNPKHAHSGARLLIDYQSDLDFMEVVFSQLGNDCSLSQIVKYLDKNPELKQINQNPALTIYTCVYNGQEWIERAMESVASQSGFNNFEYVIIDDHSTDKTCELVAKFALKHKNVTWFRNDKNLGLSSSSNLAIKKAKGRYIIRLDADDFFIGQHTLMKLLRHAQRYDLEAVYPDNYYGDYNKVQKGNEKHHAGGTLFDKVAINHIKFTDGLRAHDSLDVFLRAKDVLKIGYIEEPLFFYTQRNGSLSKTNPKKRKEIEDDLLNNWRAVEDFMNPDQDIKDLL